MESIPILFVKSKSAGSLILINVQVHSVPEAPVQLG